MADDTSEQDARTLRLLRAMSDTGVRVDARQPLTVALACIGWTHEDAGLPSGARRVRDEHGDEVGVWQAREVWSLLHAAEMVAGGEG